MQTLKNTKKTQEIKHTCEFCERTFSRESTILTHTCEPKRRWQDKNNKGNIIALSAWSQFYHKTGKKKNDYAEFVKSSYYLAFVKFGNYCVEAQVFNIPRYVDYLLKEKISIDSWNKDKHYTNFIIQYCKTENAFDAIARSIETTVELAKKDGIQTKDVFRYGNKNRICFEITKGRISPWMLYHSESGLNFLTSVDMTQQKMLLDYINPEYWSINFHKNKDTLLEIKELLRAGGY